MSGRSSGSAYARLNSGEADRAIPGEPRWRRQHVVPRSSPGCSGSRGPRSRVHLPRADHSHGGRYSVGEDLCLCGDLRRKPDPVQGLPERLLGLGEITVVGRHDFERIHDADGYTKRTPHADWFPRLISRSVDNCDGSGTVPEASLCRSFQRAAVDALLVAIVSGTLASIVAAAAWTVAARYDGILIRSPDRDRAEPFAEPQLLPTTGRACAACGTPYPQDTGAAFCRNCGNPLKEDRQTRQAAGS
jgi:hypothetical protein